MSNLSIANVLLFIVFALIHGSHSLDYFDLEALGVNCPARDSCAGYEFDKNYTQRSCECDSACVIFGDCCIDYHRRSSMIRTSSHGMTCLNIGPSNHTGIYAISSCRSSWRGLQEIRDKCEGPDDFSDPLLSVPVISTAQVVTYKNRYCAQCNNAVLASLKLFQIKLSCDGLEDLSNEQIFADIFYNETYQTWGVNRLNVENETSFYSCNIIFDVPSYLNRSVRFCRANQISTCQPSWTRNTVRRNCEEYMAVVYDNNENAYRNPHCAICNYISLNDIGCTSDISGRKPVPFSHYLDINMGDGERVGMSQVSTPSCPSNQIYDPFFKKCKRLACAIPGDVLVNGQCVRQ